MNDKSDTGAARPDDLDEATQREIDEALGGGSIEDLLDEAVALPASPTRGRRSIGPGDMVPCRIVAIDRDAVMVEMGGKDQGFVPLEQFEKDPDVGDVMQLEVVRYDKRDDMWVMSRQGAVERATWEDLTEGTIVEAFVERANKGGLEVRFSGIRAFMPVSHISIYRVEDPSTFVNQKIRCQVIEVDRRERRVIVSARAVMEVEAQEKREALLADLEEGDIREGIVRQVMPYGAFVDLGGADGLVHVSQMSYSRVENPSDLVQPGQTVKVKVLKIDRETDKISLGMKQIHPDPWDSVEVKYPAGFLATGRITKLEPFGAFVEVEPGLEGLIPISEISWTHRLRHPSDVLAVGETVQAVVIQVEPERRRLSLSLRAAQANPWTGVTQKFPPDSEQAGRVSRIAEFGAFVELEPGVEGLVHISELSYQRTRRVEDVVVVGQEVAVRVLEVDEGNRRISLSMTGVLQPGQEATEKPPPEKLKKKRKRPLRGGLD